MRQVPTVRAAALTGFGALSRSYGLDAVSILRACGLAGDAERDPDRRLPTAKVNEVLERASDLAGIEDFGLRLAGLRGFSNLGPVTFLARDEPDIRSALAVFTSFLPLHNEALAITLEERGDLAILSCSLEGVASSTQATDVSVAMLHRILRQLLGTNWAPIAIYLARQRPVRTAQFERSFAAPVHFEQDFSGIVLNCEDLDRPNRLAEAALRPYAAQLRATIPGLDGLAMAERASRLIRAMLPGPRCTAPFVAERLGISRRTMERRLAEEGTCFRTLLDQIRSELARGQLTGSRRTNAEIAELLGFSSSAAFTAWFSERHGQPPQSWKRHQTP